MNTDIRLSIEFWDHPKSVKLERRLGIKAVKCLQLLWCWVAKNTPSGDLSHLDNEDIEIAARWDGEQGAFATALCDLRWIDVDENGRRLHEWGIHNPWAAEADIRSQKARLSKLAQYRPEIYKAMKNEGVDGITKVEYERILSEPLAHRPSETPAKRQRTDSDWLAPSPSPSPSPSPYDKDKNKYSCSSGDERASEKALPTQEVKKILDKSFEEFWGFYPRKTAKADARKAFNSVLKAAPTQKKKAEMLDSIAAHLGKYLEEIEARGTEEKYIAYPGTWLRATDFSEPPPEGSREEGPTFVRCEDV